MPLTHPLRRSIGSLFVALWLAQGSTPALAAEPAPTPRNAAAAPASVEGTLQIVVEDHPTSSRTRHFVRHDGGSVELQFAGKAPALRSGARVRVKGGLNGAVLALSATDSSALTVTAAAPATVTAGELKVAVMLVNFVDDRTQPYTAAQANDVVFNQVGGFVRENSFQKTWLTGSVFGWYALPIAKTCDITAIASAGRQAAVTAGVDLAPYGRVVYVYPENKTCGWGGSANVGGTQPSAWINGWLNLNVVGHEFGHTLGLQHAHSIECGATTLVSPCTTSEYGDTVDMMGNRASGHFDPFEKEQLGWLNSAGQPAVATASASGRYTIEAYSATPGSLPKALKIPRGTDPVTGARQWYYVEYRQALGYDTALAAFTDANFLRGLVVRTATEGDGNSGTQLDVTPNSSTWDDWADAALAFGQSYSDPAAGVMLVAISGNGVAAQIDLTLSAAAGCTRAAPLVSIANPSLSAAAGSSFNHSVAVTNRDSAGCGSSSFDLGATLPAGWTSAFGATRVALAAGAAVTTTWAVTAPSGATAAVYPVTAAASNASASAYFGNATANDTVGAPAVSPVATTVTTDKAAYKLGETIAATARVTSGATPVANASVKFTFAKAGGATAVKSAVTDASGMARVSYRSSRKDPGGAWQLIDTAAVGVQSASATVAFTVE